MKLLRKTIRILAFLVLLCAPCLPMYGQEVEMQASPSCHDELGEGLEDISLPYEATDRSTCGSGDDLGPDNLENCGSLFALQSEDDIYRFTPDSTATYTIGISGQDFYGNITLYDGCPLDGRGANCVGSQHEEGTSKNIVAELSAGMTYYLIVDNSFGCFTYNLIIEETGSCPDDLGTGVIIVDVLPYSAPDMTTCGKVNDFTGLNSVACLNSSDDYGGEDEIYVIEPTTTGIYHFTITLNQAFTGAGMTLFGACPFEAGEMTCLGAVNDPIDLVQVISAMLESGQTYYLLIDGSGSPECFGYGLEIGAPAGCPGGLGGSINEIEIPFEGSGLSTCGSGDDLSDANLESCTEDVFTVGQEDVYLFSPSESGLYEISLTNPSVTNTSIRIYDGCPLLGQGGQCLEALSSGSGNIVYVDSLHSDITYYMIVEGNSVEDCFTYDLSIRAPLSCMESLGDGVQMIDALPYVATSQTTCDAGNNVFAANSPSCASASAIEGEDMVYIFTPGMTAVYHITLTNVTTATTSLSLFSGCPLNGGGGECVQSNVSFVGNNLMSVNLQAGITYYLVVDHDPGPDCFVFDLSIDVPAECPDGLGSDIVQISELPYDADDQTTCGAANDLGAYNTVACGFGTFLSGRDVVYTFTAPETNEYEVALTEFSNQVASITLFEGCPLTDQGGTCVNFVHNATNQPKIIKDTLTGGVTYYLVVDNAAPDECFTYDILIRLSTTPILEKPELGPDTTICSNDSLVLDAGNEGATSFQWQDGSSGQTLTVSEAGTYSVTVTDTSGFFGADTIVVSTIQAPAIPEIIVTGPTTFCAGQETTTLTSTIENNVRWNNNLQQPRLIPLVSGDYFVTHTVNGCSSVSASVKIHVDQESFIDYLNIPTSLCEGDSVTLSVINPGNLTWSDGSNTTELVISPDETTTYAITSVSDSGCVYTDQVTINVVPPVAPGVVMDMRPSEGQVNLLPPYEFSWPAASNASTYNLWIWLASEARPAQPEIGSIQDIKQTLGFLEAGKAYNWQVEALNSCQSTLGAIQTFTTAEAPDLNVDKIQAPEFVFASERLAVSFRVTNDGSGGTGQKSWLDAIFLSLDDELDGSDILLGRRPNISFLGPGQSYVQNLEFDVPDEAIGAFNVLVFADVPVNGNDALAESDEINNLPLAVESPKVTVDIPPRPDLQLTSIGVPTAIFSGASISVNYTGRNSGTFQAVSRLSRQTFGRSGLNGCQLRETYWTDGIYLSRDSIFNADSAILLSSTRIGARSMQFDQPDCSLEEAWIATPDHLPVDSSYQNVVQVVVPHFLYGTYYIHVIGDMFDLVKELGESNNSIRSEAIDITLTPPADLLAEEIIVPADGASGLDITVNWTVENVGATAPVERAWKDQFYISSLDTFNAEQAQPIGYGFYTNGHQLAAGSSYSRQMALTIPDGLQGVHYIFMKTDAEGNVFEFDLKANNIVRSNGIDITLSPSADLIVSSFTVPDTILTGNPTEITYGVQNIGEAMASANWTDRIYYSPLVPWDPSRAAALSATVVNNDLPENESYSRSMTITIPRYLAGTGYLYIFTDAEDKVYEEHGNTNNISNQSQFPQNVGSITVLPGTADLAISNFEALSVGQAGNPVRIEYEITNIGQVPTTREVWRDYLFLSEDAVLDIGDEVIGIREHAGLLAANESYNVNTTVAIPNGVSGDYYLLISTDHERKVVNEEIVNNNTANVALEVTLLPSPDFQVLSLKTPSDTLVAGQRIQLPYEVENTGTGSTDGGRWYDCIYLSTTRVVTNQSIRLSNLAVNDVVKPEANYSKNPEVDIPPYAQGSYYLVLQVDCNNSIYEHEGEDNNVQFVPIEIQPASPTDIVVSDLAMPEEAILGEDISVGYTISNVGANPAIGVNADAWLFSADDSFEGTEDQVFTLQRQYIELEPGESMNVQFDKMLDGLDENQYYGIGWTNRQHILSESNFENNQVFTTGRMAVSIRQLDLEVEESATLTADNYLYYKVFVQANKDLIVTLQSDEDNIPNEMYIAYDRVPTSEDHDARHSTTNASNQCVLVPETREGYYYVMIRTPIFNAMDQGVAILAQALPFQILEITPATVGQSVVSTQISGAGFRASTDFFLVDGSGLEIAAAEIKDFVSSMSATLQWDMTNVPLGTYGLRAVNQAEEITVANAIKLEESTGYQLDYKEVVPDELRFGRNGLLSFYLTNVGNVDIPFVQGNLTIPVGTKVDEFSISKNGRSRVEFLPEEFVEVTQEYYDFEISRILPFIGLDLAPGEFIYLNVQISDFSPPLMPAVFEASALSKESFTRTQLFYIENLRKSILEGGGIPDSEYLSNYLDSAGFTQSLLAPMYERGYFDSMFVASLDFRCVECKLPVLESESAETLNPYSGIRTAVYEEVVFGSGMVYDWKINNYQGNPGDNPGWDFIEVENVLRITATVDNPFTIRMASFDFNGNADYLSGWYPAVDNCWPVAYAAEGIEGFEPDKVILNIDEFAAYNELYGGTFHITSSENYLNVCFTAYKPGIGENGVPGAPGQTGQDGSPGGPGGPGDGIILPGAGGRGGDGGPADLNMLAGKGGPGGKGGMGGIGQDGGTGGEGGIGGDGGNGPGGSGGNGGPGGSSGDLLQALNYDSASPLSSFQVGAGGRGGKGGNGGKGGKGNPGGKGGEGGKGGTGVNSTGTPGMAGEEGNSQSLTLPLIPFNSSFRTVDIGECAGTGFLGVLGFGALYHSGLIPGTPTSGPGSMPVQLTEQEAADLEQIENRVLAIFAAQLCLPVIIPKDPNDILGPDGYLPGRFVARSSTLPYTIRFENDSTFASAAAQRVEIRQAIDPHLDPLSFRLQSFGFNSQVYDIPDNRAHYQRTIPLADSLGYDVELTAGVDIVNRELFWVFNTIDPVAGLPPANALTGFLPINDALGSGEGFVNYTIRPSSTAVTGDTIYAKADIVFDINAPISTPEIYNVVDALPPISEVEDLPLFNPDTTFTVSWTGQDDAGGSGIRSYQLFYSENDGPFEAVDSAITGTSASFTGEYGNAYDLYVRATDNVGNVEATKNLPEATTIIERPGFILEPNRTSSFCLLDNLVIRWDTTSVASLDLEISADGGDTYSPIALAVDPTQNLLDWPIPEDLMPGTQYLVRVLDNASGMSIDTSQSFVIRNLPLADAGTDTTLCEGTSIELGGAPSAFGTEAPYSYIWSPGLDMDNSTVANPVATSGGVFVLQITDAFGCAASDTIEVMEKPTPARPVITKMDTLLMSSAESGNQWFLDGVKIEGATGQTLAPEAMGAYTVIVNINGCTSELSEPFEFGTVSVLEIDGLRLFQVQPNPTDGQTAIIIEGLPSDRVNIQIRNMYGQLVQSEFIGNFPGSLRHMINLEDLAIGMYVVVLEYKDQWTRRALVKY